METRDWLVAYQAGEKWKLNLLDSEIHNQEKKKKKKESASLAPTHSLELQGALQ